MNVTESKLRYMFVAFFIVIIFGLCFASYIGKKQDNEFVADQASFSQGVAYLQNGQLNEALQLLKSLDNKDYESYLLKYYKSYTLLNIGEIPASIKEFENVIDLNPYIVEEPMFMLQYARALILAENWEGATKVLERSKTLKNPEQMPDYQNQIDELFMQIDQSRKEE